MRKGWTIAAGVLAVALLIGALPGNTQAQQLIRAAQSGTWNIATVTTVTAVTAISNALPAGNNNIGDVDAIQSGTWNITNVSGTVSLPTGASTAANQSTANGSLSTIAGDTTDIEAAVELCSGATESYTTSAASTNATSVKGSPGTLCGIEVVNTTSTIYYLRLYNLSSAPTCSSSTGFRRSIPIPHGTGTGAGIVSQMPYGVTYGTGIGFCLTGGGGNTDNTNAATGVYITVTYK